MTPDQFIAKWKSAELKERAAAQSHFIDLCRMLDEPTPTDTDPKGEFYAFERGATKTTGGEGWADVWKKGHFGWEYKGKRKDLNAAFTQLQQYALALENPPLLVVCDLDRFRIHTNWTNTVSKVHEFSLDDLRKPEVRQLLKWTLCDPEQLRPGKTRQALTEDAAGKFAELAQRMRLKGHAADVVAHFINRLVFCMFAEDVGLLPDKMFRRMLEHAIDGVSDFVEVAQELFRAMRTGGRVGFESVLWFNGGLFDDDAALPLEKAEIALVLGVAKLDWAEIDPSILGTLFERGLDPDKRSQLGAHYTDREKINLIIEPVIVRPWLSDWAATRKAIEAQLGPAQAALDAELAIAAEFPELADDVTEVRSRAKRGPQMELFTELGRQRRVRSLDLVRSQLRAADRSLQQALADAQAAYLDFLRRLWSFRVLDPACGSGNFLYLALLALKDLEHRAGIEAEILGLQRMFPEVGPSSVKGIEINPYAAELARVTVWIGEIQWMRKNGFDVPRDPILRPLETIECRDALLDGDGTLARWPQANVIVGNPPFLGSRKMKPKLSEGYVNSLRKAYKSVVPKGADFVCYWFAKAWAEVDAEHVERAGLVSTSSISGGASRSVLKPISTSMLLYEVWDKQPWTVDGAAVEVALICFGRHTDGRRRLNGEEVDVIFSDLHSRTMSKGTDLAAALALQKNSSIAFQGVVPRGSINKADAKKMGLPVASFVIPGPAARTLLTEPINPNGRPNSDVVIPYLVGDDLAQRPRDRFVVDFQTMSERDAELYEGPFRFIRPVKQHRLAMAQPEAVETWWQHWRSRPELRDAIAPLRRFIVTPRVSKHRFFCFRSLPVVIDNAIVVIAREDDTTFGILHSRFHEAWSLRKGTSLEDRPRYTPSTTFETFPFPEGLTPDIASTAYEADLRSIQNYSRSQAVGRTAGELAQPRRPCQAGARGRARLP